MKPRKPTKFRPTAPLIISDGTVKLTANNTLNWPLRIGLGGILRFSKVGNVGVGSSNLGAPSDLFL